MRRGNYILKKKRGKEGRPQGAAAIARHDRENDPAFVIIEQLLLDDGSIIRPRHPSALCQFRCLERQ